MRVPLALTLFSILIACRPVDVSIRPARVVSISALPETDSTAISNVRQAMIINDSTLVIRVGGADGIFVFNIRRSQLLSSFRLRSDIVERVEPLLPMAFEGELNKLGFYGDKLSIDVVRKNYLQTDVPGMFSLYGDLYGFDMIGSDSLIIASGVIYPYFRDGVGDEKTTTRMPFPLLVRAALDGSGYSPSVLPWHHSLNVYPTNNVVCMLGNSAWIGVGDYYPQEYSGPRSTDLMGAITAKYSSHGSFRGVVSREMSDMPNLERMQRSRQFLCEGIDSNSLVRVLSIAKSVDLVNTDDGSYRRIPMPASIRQLEDTLGFDARQLVRFGGDKIAVHIALIKSKPWRNFIVTGKLSADRAEIAWTNVLECQVGGHNLLDIVDTNESPLFRNQLLAIFEDPSVGPYLARIESMVGE
jgi:hypothetical protein